jgi:hypothetical protein
MGWSGAGVPTGTYAVAPVPSPAAPAVLATAGLPVVPTPPFARQVEEGKVLVEYHTNSLQSGKTYRFRVQLIVVNPLTSLQPDTKKDDAKKVTDVKDTKVATIALPLSEWSDPVSIPKATHFFVTGGSDSVNEVNVVVFSQCLGQRVKKAYSLKVGQMIGTKAELVDVINPMENAKKLKTQADFSTGATALSFDFNKRAFSKTGVEMVYLDDQGCLKSRVAALDDGSEPYKQLGAEYKETVTRLQAIK